MGKNLVSCFFETQCISVFDTEPETLELEARHFTTAAKLRGSCKVGILAVVTFDIAKKKLGEWASHCSSPFIKCTRLLD